MLWQNFLLAFDSEICSSIKSFDFSQKETGYSQFFYIWEVCFCTARGSRPHIFYKKDVLKLLAIFVLESICVEGFFKIQFQTVLFGTPLGNRLCTIKNIRNILGTISKGYVFWRPITLLTALLKINRTEGSHVKILTNLTRNHLQWSLFQ